MAGGTEIKAAGAPGRRRVLAGLAAGAAGVAAGLFRGPAEAVVTRRPPGNVCPAGNTTANPNGFRVFRFTGPPLADDATTIGRFQSWPVTDAVTSQDTSVVSTWTGGGMLNNWPINAWFYVWANRKADPGQTLIAPNPILGPPIQHPDNGRECRASYTTYAKANAATQCLIRYWLGRSDYQDPWLAISGTSADDFVFYAALAADPATYFTTAQVVANAHDNSTYMVMTDRPWLPSAVDAAPGVTYQRANMMLGTSLHAQTPGQFAPGIVLDYEVADGRSTGVGTTKNDPDGSYNFIRRICQDIHATVDGNGQAQAPAQVFLYTDPLNGASMPNSGLNNTNLPAISRTLVDYLSITLWGGNAEGNMVLSYLDQLRVLKNTLVNPAPWSKLVLVLDLAAPIGYAYYARRLLLRGVLPIPTAPSTVLFWNDGAGNCTTGTDEKINVALTGVPY
jgi:hypothetical protein